MKKQASNLNFLSAPIRVHLRLIPTSRSAERTSENSLTSIGLRCSVPSAFCLLPSAFCLLPLISNHANQRPLLIQEPSAYAFVQRKIPLA